MQIQTSFARPDVRSRRMVRALTIMPLFALNVVALSACSDDMTATPSVATSILVTSGDNQAVQINTSAALPLAAIVVDQSGVGMSGQTVTWAISSGNGELSAATSTTDAFGIAQITYTAGADAGTVTITGTVNGTLSTIFTATVVPVPLVATSIAVMSGNNQTVQVSTAAALPLEVKVVGQNGDAMNGQTVTWAISTGNGALSAATSTTDTFGLAQITYLAGADAGIVTITGTVNSTLIAIFTATVVPVP